MSYSDTNKRRRSLEKKTKTPWLTSKLLTKDLVFILIILRTLLVLQSTPENTPRLVDILIT